MAGVARISENTDTRCSVVLTRQEYELLASGAADSIVLDSPRQGTVHLRVEDPSDARIVHSLVTP